MSTETLPANESTALISELAQAQRRRRRSIAIFVIVSLLNVALLAVLWSQLLTPAPGQNSTRSNAGSAGFSGPMVGKMAPDFRLPLLAPGAGSNSTVALSDFKGQALVLNVWQSSCEPCQREAPILQATWQRVQGQGIVFLGLDFQDNRHDALTFLQAHGITYTNVSDSSGATAISYGVANLPTTIFIDRTGKIVGWHEGELTVQLLEQGLKLLSH
ncbi:TlpA family protein disulfide reductase [Thermogemmatispora sp.]|uniref:TlpA family protein disulfide reductase n=1 Tax=Thermogemmatispora sp. TaxID=1968838 RepID=UPI001DA54EEE|nr:TlpA disulfide reductase family protein [Thermogemmatispora sp.]MBX5451492.1 TlpA family protein disulfide reductase [Thermogemmatispora sp.]